MIHSREAPHVLRPWSLPEAFEIRRKDVVAFVGGGGKTTAMFRLADALAAEGWHVITTTTTHIGREESSLAPHHYWFDRSPSGIGEMLAALRTHRHILVTGPLVEGGSRWGGVSAEWVAQAAASPQVDAVLVEADGARDLPFKAPAAHEPVIPPATTLLVPVVGVDAVGQAIQDIAHRPALVCALCGLEPEDELTAEAIATVLAHPMGGLKGRPPAARVRVLVNKVGRRAELASARQIAQKLLLPHYRGETDQALPARERDGRGENISAVIIGAVGTCDPIREVRRRVAAVVAAAGRSSRMGGETAKQLLPWAESTVIGRVLETLAQCPISPLLVVTGHCAEKVRQELAETGIQTIFNPDYRTGEMLSSIQVGVDALGSAVSGCLVVLADQPWLQAEIVESLLDAYASSPAGIVAPVFQGRRGHPVLIDRRHWAELLALEPGLAPRHLLQRHPVDTHLVLVESDSVIRDMDTLDEYHQALDRSNLHHR